MLRDSSFLTPQSHHENKVIHRYWGSAMRHFFRGVITDNWSSTGGRKHHRIIVKNRVFLQRVGRIITESKVILRWWGEIFLYKLKNLLKLNGTFTISCWNIIQAIRRSHIKSLEIINSWSWIKIQIMEDMTGKRIWILKKIPQSLKKLKTGWNSTYQNRIRSRKFNWILRQDHLHVRITVAVLRSCSGQGMGRQTLLALGIWKHVACGNILSKISPG